MIVNHWPPWFRQLYGGAWPDTYCCFDLETSGYAFDRDVITQIGYVLVRGGTVFDAREATIDWTGHAVVPDHWLRARLAALKSGMASAGKPCHVTYERMRAEGVRPEEALPGYRGVFERLIEARVPIVAHNGYQFDERMLNANLVGFGHGPPFSFGDNTLLDTSAIEKASQVESNSKLHPREGDTLRSYFTRVVHARISGIKSNLDDWCFGKYQLGSKYGVDRGSLHGALADSMCLHYLMEEYRALVVPGGAEPPFEPGPARGLVSCEAATMMPAPAAVRRRGQRRR